MTASDLTDEQQRVATAPLGARQLVIAGPGTGKTHTLVARLATLIQDHGLSPGGGALVLSFSRAAVRAIRERVRAAGGDVSYVRARTFDSFATALLNEHDPEGPWRGAASYEARIRFATKLFEDNADVLQEFEHIIVDEVQDLVGERADFVKAILESSSSGFTLFGDPAQGIYSFQQENGAWEIGSGALIEWLGGMFPELIRLTLTKNFRGTTPTSRAVDWAGPLLNGDEPDYRQIRYDLMTALKALDEVGALKVAGPKLASGGSTAAILCRDNGQALTVSRQLREENVPHSLQRDATDRVIPPWVAIALSTLARARVDERDLCAILTSNFGVDAATARDSFRQLRFGAPAGPFLDVNELADRMRSGNLADELTVAAPSSLVVSTIHRAKGLEFDRVVVMEPYERDQSNEAEEARVLYVAMTRARRELYAMRTSDTRRLFVRDDLERRWLRHGKARGAVVGFEVRGDDTHTADPIGAFLASGDVSERQAYLRKQVHVGDPVKLVLLTASSSGEERAHYMVLHRASEPIGVTSERFADLLRRALGGSRGARTNWPVEIWDLFADGIDSVAGTGAAAERSGLPLPIWLRARVTGLGILQFDRDALERIRNRAVGPPRELLIR